METQTQDVVETVARNPLNKKVVVVAAVSLIAAGAVVMALRVRNARNESDTVEPTTEV